MSIIYSVVVRQDDNGQQMTLCNYDTAQGNYPAITEQILKKIKLQDDISYKFNSEYPHPHSDTSTTSKKTDTYSSSASRTTPSK